MNETKPKTTPKDFFLWVAVMVTLYISAVSLLTLLFEYIDIVFKSPLQTYYDPFSGAIRFAIASLIIIFPMYLYFTRVLNKDIRKHSEKGELGVRKWLVFFTLFVAGATIVIDLIILINTFLGGEQITTAFILKVLSVLVVIGGVFMYYLNDIRGTWERSPQTSKTIGLIVSLTVLTAIVSGFFVIGSPQTQQLFRFDQDKINDLSSIQWQVVNFYQQKERLPETLEELEDPLIGFILPKDSQTDKEYGYVQVEDLKFQLCAEFNKESRGYSVEGPRAVKTESLVGYGFENENWTHTEGDACFERTVDPDKFPPIRR